MSNTNTGGPAFPEVNYKQPVGGGTHMMTIHGGMTLRDYAAFKAMQGLLSDLDWRMDMGPEETARAAYIQADAMLKAREA